MEINFFLFLNFNNRKDFINTEIHARDAIYYAKAAGFIGAALAMGIGSIGPALGQGLVGTKACESIGRNPESANKVRNTMIIALGMIESSAVYCLVIAGVLVTVASNLN